MRQFFGRSVRPALGLVTVAAFLYASGCSSAPPTSEVSGTVSYKGKKLGSGTIAFVGKDGRGHSEINPDGTYRIFKAPRGPVKVTVETPPPLGATLAKPKMMKDAGATPPAADEGPKGTYVAVPKKYSAEDSTPLTYDVTAAKQEKDFDLTD